MPISSHFEAAKSGDRRALAKLLSAIENGEVDDIDFDSKHDNIVVGITGAPGVGKSCLVDRMLAHWSAAGQTTAVLAVDPSSPLTGGALLGDRLRMQIADEDDNVYVRSVATRNQPGGLPIRLRQMAAALAACGWNRVLVETVGSGQSEIRIVAVADLVLLVEGPARGDIIQAEKAGVLELADAVAVNKSDLDGAERVADEISSALQISGNPPPVLLVSALTGEGIEDLCSILNTLTPRESAKRARLRERLIAAWESALLEREDLEEVLESILAGETDVSDWVGAQLR